MNASLVGFFFFTITEDNLTAACFDFPYFTLVTYTAALSAEIYQGPRSRGGKGGSSPPTFLADNIIF